jgi:hypothetical protein
MLGICVLRVINNTDSMVKDLRLSYRRADSSALRYEEVGDLRPGEVRELKIVQKDISGDEVLYGFGGEVRRRPISAYIYAGNILEIQFVPGGWVQSRLTE